MGAILAALASQIFGFLFRTIIIKFFLFAVIWVVTNFFLSELISYLPDFSGGLSSAFAAWTPNMWFLADTMSLTNGLPLVISAYLARFAIRRIPFVG